MHVFLTEGRIRSYITNTHMQYRLFPVSIIATSFHANRRKQDERNSVRTCISLCLLLFVLERKSCRKMQIKYGLLEETCIQIQSRFVMRASVTSKMILFFSWLPRLRLRILLGVVVIPWGELFSLSFGNPLNEPFWRSFLDDRWSQMSASPVLNVSLSQFVHKYWRFFSFHSKTFFSLVEEVEEEFGCYHHHFQKVSTTFLARRAHNESWPELELMNNGAFSPLSLSLTSLEKDESVIVSPSEVTCEVFLAEKKSLLSWRRYDWRCLNLNKRNRTAGFLGGTKNLEEKRCPQIDRETNRGYYRQSTYTPKTKMFRRDEKLLRNQVSTIGV